MTRYDDMAHDDDDGMATEYSLDYRDAAGRMVAVTSIGGMGLEDVIDFAINAARRRGAHLIIIRADGIHTVARYGLMEGVWVSLPLGDPQC